ncbi:hypothetical protein HBB16_09450 [Pseudonocardia sp. MCCB 268]|nr:hypothetical protein [Pseudonocardia cytotoxica]
MDGPRDLPRRDPGARDGVQVDDALSLHAAQRALQHTLAKPRPRGRRRHPRRLLGSNTTNKAHMTEPYVSSMVRIPFV